MYQSPYVDIVVEGQVTQVTRFFKVMVYGGAIVPHHSSGKLYFKICYPHKYELDWRSGMTNVFGFNRQPDLNSPITADSFYSVTSVISNDDYRDIREKVESISASKENELVPI